MHICIKCTIYTVHRVAYTVHVYNIQLLQCILYSLYWLYKLPYKVKIDLYIFGIKEINY